METTAYLEKILAELSQGSNLIDDQEAEKLVNAILDAEQVFVAGGGRSGLALKSFAMRMMHVGLDPYVVGETVTSNFTKDDILILGSGSGETKGLVGVAEKANKIGGTIVAVTTAADSTIAGLADIVVKLPGAPKDQSTSSYQTIQPMGSLFEQTLLLFLDAVVLRFMEKKGRDTAHMYGRHANLE